MALLTRYRSRTRSVLAIPKFYFSVDIGDFTDLPFQEVSGLDIETEVIEYRTEIVKSFYIKCPD